MILMPRRRSSSPARASAETPWRRHLLVASGCAAVGVAVHAAGSFLPALVTTVGLGVGLLGASFLLAWAADAGEAVFSGGLVLAAVAPGLVTALQRRVTGGILGPIITHLVWSLGMLFLLPPMLSIGAP